MTSATIRQARDASQGEGYWMIVFAAALLVTVGIFNLIDGIAAIANSHVFIANAHYVIGDLRAWGWVVAHPRRAAGHRRDRRTGRQSGRPLVRGGRDRPQRHRPDVVHPGLPVLVAVDHRRGRGGPVGTVRLRKPREPDRLAATIYRTRAPGVDMADKRPFHRGRPAATWARNQDQSFPFFTTAQGNPSTPCLRCRRSAHAMTRFTRPLKPSKLMSPGCPEPPWHVIIPGMGGGPGRLRHHAG